MIDVAALRAPLPYGEHSWRAQQVTREGTRAQALCFITSRAVQNRLDDVCGPAGWEGTFDETASGRVIATIRILVGDRWIAKSDGAGATAMEGEKGGLSGAFKRAAVMWGIGRYLYDLPAIWAECDARRTREGQLELRNGKPVWQKWTMRGEAQLENALRALFDRMGAADQARLPPPAQAEPIDLTPVPAAEPLRLGHAPAFRQPLCVTELLEGLPAAIREGRGAAYWSERVKDVPDMWRAFVIAEKDRMVREASH